MGIEITLRGGIIGLLIIIWILGKAVWSIPTLCKESKSKKDSEAYGDLIILLGLRIMGVLLLLGISIWVLSKLSYDFDVISDIAFAVFVALFFSGFCSFFVLITTFIIAKLSNIQKKTKAVDLLDDGTEFD
ncbi:MAG: O-antigen ligase [Aureispira sp.]|jgi:O-antigen ligase